MRLIISLLLLLFGAGAAQAAWHRAESANFIVHAETSEAEIRETALELERFDRMLRLRAGIDAAPGPVKFRVYFVARPGDVRAFLDDSPRGTSGYYTPSMRGPAAVVPRRGTGGGTYALGADEILFHEYAHHFMYQYFPATYPAWYVEGFAEFFQTADFEEDGSIVIGRVSGNRALGLAYENWVPYAQLLANTRDHGFSAYTQGWLLTHFAVFDEAAGAMLRQYLTALHGGQSGAEAYRASFARHQPSLDRTLQQYMRRPRLPGLSMVIHGLTPSDVTVTALSDEQGEIALLFPRDPRTLARRIAELVERYPNNPQAHVETAISALATDDFAAAEAAADRALALDADHVEANLAKGLALIGAADANGDPQDPRWAEGRQHFLRANRANPENAAPLFGYYQSFPNPADRPENAMTALEGAFALVPQNGEIRLELAEQYLRDGRHREASILVMPVVQSVHESEARAAARRLLEEARAQGGETVIAED